jgi:hypothetical protein
MTFPASEPGSHEKNKLYYFLEYAQPPLVFACPAEKLLSKRPIRMIDIAGPDPSLPAGRRHLPKKNDKLFQRQIPAQACLPKRKPVPGRQGREWLFLLDSLTQSQIVNFSTNHWCCLPNRITQGVRRWVTNDF